MLEILLELYCLTSGEQNNLHITSAPLHLLVTNPRDGLFPYSFLK